MRAYLYHLNFIWKNFEQNRRTFFSTINHHPSVTTSGPKGLEPRGWTSDGYILKEPNTFSQEAWVLYAWVLITLNWEAFFFPFSLRSGFPHFVKLAALEIPIIYDGSHKRYTLFALSLKRSTCKTREILYKRLKKYCIFITQSVRVLIALHKRYTALRFQLKTKTQHVQD